MSPIVPLRGLKGTKNMIFPQQMTYPASTLKVLFNDISQGYIEQKV